MKHAGRSKSGIHHVALRSRDFDAAVRFYVEGLGCRETLRWGEGDKRAVMLDTGDGSCIEIFAGGKEPRPEGSLLHFALRTDNCDAATDKARTAGAKITMQPADVAVDASPAPFKARISFCQGPDGETIEFFQLK